MLQNSSALEIKKRQAVAVAVAVRQAMHGMGAWFGDGGIGSKLYPETRCKWKQREIEIGTEREREREG